MRVTILSMIVALSFAVAPVSAQAIAQSYKLNIPRQPLDGALKDLAQQTGFQIARFSDTPGGAVLVGPLSGTMTVGQALTSLLSTSGLTYRVVNDRTIALIPSGPTASSSTPTDPPTSNRSSEPARDGQMDSSDRFRVAQVDQGQTSNPSVEGAERASKQKILEEVVVTGSRIPRSATQGAQDVKIYTHEQIEHSGQTTVADFFNTIPDVSVAASENTPILGIVPGATTVQLHGLPIGTTLILINGRRVEVSGSQGANGSNFFDLNTIPIAAVERIEVISEGSSAIYGSDAIAGVINVILRKDFTGIDAAVKYGWASSTHETDASAAWGQKWDKGSFSLVANYQTRSELTGFERGITASDDKTHFGGQDNRLGICNPGNVFFPNGFSFNGQPPVQFAAVPAGFTSAPSIQEFASTAGMMNKCNLGGYADLIPASRRAGVFAAAQLAVTSQAEAFAELMYTYIEQDNQGDPPSAFAFPGFSLFTVSAANPFNPFKQPVGISYLFTEVGRQGIPVNTAFFRPLAGLRGSLPGSWRWELAGWIARDESQMTITNSINDDAVQAALNSSNPQMALNLFTAGSPGSAALIRSLLVNQRQDFLGQTSAVNAYAEGPLVTLPAGPIHLAVGTEYDSDKLYFDQFNVSGVAPNNHATYSRNRYAVFGEARIPILGHPQGAHLGDQLALTLAGRYDHYARFGSKATPQVGLEWRPAEALLFRGNYARSFKAPGLFNLFDPTTSFQSFVSDPKLGGQLVEINAITGGNLQLRPETGWSKTYGFVYSSQAISDLQLSITHWQIEESDSVQQVDLQTLADNEDLFPGNVTRAPSHNGQPGPIIQINSTFVNFGEIDVSGVDFRLNYKLSTEWGQLAPSLSATNTYRYTAALIPGTAPTDRTSRANIDGNFAPRWKGTAAMAWTRGPWSMSFDGRYVGHYIDYDGIRTIGNFWLFDANLSYAIGELLRPNPILPQNSRVVVGAVNLFNTLPQFSNFDFGNFGYDPAEGDIRGRFVYLQYQAKF